MYLLEPLDRLVQAAIRLWTYPVAGTEYKDGKSRIVLFPSRAYRKSAERTDSESNVARESLQAAFDAVKRLQDDAFASEQALAHTSETLQAVHEKKALADRELESVRQIAASDITAFQKLAGVPSPTQVARERFIGFILGVLASLLATAVWTFLRWLR